jgi:hypothetical protein
MDDIWKDIQSVPDFTGRKCRMPIGSRFQDEPLQRWTG